MSAVRRLVSLGCAGLCGLGLALLASLGASSQAASPDTLPTVTPLFKTQALVGPGRHGRIGFLYGVGGLLDAGTGTSVRVRCVVGCSGSGAVRLKATKATIQLRLRKRIVLFSKAVVELRATRARSVGWWARYRMTRARMSVSGRRATVVSVRSTSSGCLSSKRRRQACPDPVPLAPEIPPETPAVPTTVTPPAAPETTTAPAAAPVVVAAPSSSPPKTYAEQQGSHGVNTFSNPTNASGPGPRIDVGWWVDVSCKVYAPQIASVNPDGYWYRVATAPWSNAYYAPANTFWNGDVPGQKPYTHNTDFAVPDC